MGSNHLGQHRYPQGKCYLPLDGIRINLYDNVGYYDFIYLAWTEDEPKQLLSGVLPVEPQGKLAATWADVKAGVGVVGSGYAPLT